MADAAAIASFAESNIVRASYIADSLTGSHAGMAVDAEVDASVEPPSLEEMGLAPTVIEMV